MEQNNVIPIMEQSGVDGKKAMVVQTDVVDEGDFSLLRIEGCPRNVAYSTGFCDKPLSCFGCGIGWFSFVLGFVFPPLWYYATILYFGKYYLKDPRERSGLAASAIAALICTAAVFVSLFAVFL